VIGGGVLWSLCKKEPALKAGETKGNTEILDQSPTVARQSYDICHSQGRSAAHAWLGARNGAVQIIKHGTKVRIIDQKLKFSMDELGDGNLFPARPSCPIELALPAPIESVI
jgi:hypothetical protein